MAGWGTGASGATCVTLSAVDVVPRGGARCGRGATDVTSHGASNGQSLTVSSPAGEPLQGQRGSNGRVYPRGPLTLIFAKACAEPWGWSWSSS